MTTATTVATEPTIAAGDAARLLGSARTMLPGQEPAVYTVLDSLARSLDGGANMTVTPSSLIASLTFLNPESGVTNALLRPMLAQLLEGQADFAAELHTSELPRWTHAWMG
jgi:hypothetical protein